MVFLIYGPEKKAVDYEVSKVTSSAGEVFRFNGYEDGCLNEFDQMTLLGKSVYVLEYDTLGAEEKLVKFIQKNRGTSSDLVITAKSVRQPNKLLALIKDKGTVMKCDKYKMSMLESYITRGVKSCGARITRDACEELISRSGYLDTDEVDLYKISILVKQLSYAGRDITIDLVRDIVPERLEGRAALLLTFAVQGNEKALLKEGEVCFAQGNKPIMLYGWMLRNLRIALKCRLYSELGEAKLEENLGLTHRQLRAVSDVRELGEVSLFRMISTLNNAVGGVKEGKDSRTEFLATLGKLARKEEICT